MKVLICDNIHLFKDRNGCFFSSSVYSYDFFRRYLNVFDTIKIIGKVRPLPMGKSVEDYLMVSGPNIEVIELPWYKGMREMIKKLPNLLKSYSAITKDVDCCIFRIAQIESFFVYLFWCFNKKPFAVEVVNDPQSFNGLFIRTGSVFMVKHMCKKANGASYVTEYFLQSKYPNHALQKGESSSFFSSYYSSVELAASDLATSSIKYSTDKVFKIIHVANAIDTDVKGHYTLIKAISEVVKQGYKISVKCVGDGNKVKEYEAYIDELHLSEVIKFVGRKSNKTELFSLLKESNLMVLPTQMEGLPRVIIEAMAVGLPCLSTPIAGIPELIEEKYLFAPFDYKGFAQEIIRLLNNSKELEQMSINNLKKAKLFTREVLEPRRTDFYTKLRDVSLNRDNKKTLRFGKH